MPGFLFIDSRPAAMVDKSMALTLYDVFTLNLANVDDARVRLAEAVCDRHYYLYTDDAGNDVRVPESALLTTDASAIPIWTMDMDQTIIEWTNIDPTQFGIGGAWLREGEGWTRTRAHEPGELD
jgi:hypothetical protein